MIHTDVMLSQSDEVLSQHYKILHQNDEISDKYEMYDYGTLSQYDVIISKILR